MTPSPYLFGRWIPCAERKPPGRAWYIVQLALAKYPVAAHFDFGNWYLDNYQVTDDTITHWLDASARLEDDEAVVEAVAAEVVKQSRFDNERGRPAWALLTQDENAVELLKAISSALRAALPPAKETP